MEESLDDSDQIAADASNPPWFQDPTRSKPFTPFKTVDLDFVEECYCAALFPWSEQSLNALWHGEKDNEEFRNPWKQMISDWSGALAIGTLDSLLVIPLSASRSRKGLSVSVPNQEQNTPVKKTSVMALGWALTLEAPLEPLVVFSAGSILYILNAVKGEIISHLRGHGGPITSIVVHPTHPYLFCTTSRDFTTRIYDLTMSPQQGPDNPCWPPSKAPSLGGAPHGLQASEPEGVGIGRCIVVLCGGPSGGHEAAVLNAAFHPTHPLIATCGLDRAVKIWCFSPLEDLSSNKLVREDKPLFSSTRIHKARIMSVSWLSTDTLVTHSAPALMRRHDRKDDIYHEDGTVTIFRWIGFDRFFPAGSEPSSSAQVFRGCSSDYQESSSFTLISTSSLPQLTRHIHVTQTFTGDYILALSLPDSVCLYNLAKFHPRVIAPDPPEHDIESDLELSRLRLDDDGEDEEQPISNIFGKSPEAQRWEVLVPGAQESVQACVLGFGGQLLVTLEKRRVCIWRETVR
ncbi:WD40-repeat-containing domain protein [Suillus clintonianus]|uniref:WD40-repeat-containing domain protein n=1 Tax=Suillus clintonianus TaxID=1904413 RepID=UPI001B85B64F|nr:WD40-repeat-containing domain protein [Suillus clintonianus]KAG2154785.1 WD40-repeat-containing domain protein [Suillus clintonianus]